MNNTSKWLSLAQTIFYFGAALIIPQLIADLGATGTLFGFITVPVALTAPIIWILNQIENVMAANNKGAMFGMFKPTNSYSQD